MGLKKEDLLSMYHEIVLIRRFEEAASELYAKKEIGGVYLHLANGQEAVITGAIRALRDDDQVITAYRDHGHAISRGVHPNYVMAEMFGKATGTSGGKGGSMHIASKEHHFWGGYAIVGGHLPLAAGLALADQYNGKENVTLSYVGDGASNNGYFHESLNLTAVWDLPVIWLIENNLYGMGTSVEESSGNPRLIERAIAYGMHSLPRIDGQDPLAVYDAITEAAEYARTKGPVLLEAMTYRYLGHGVSDRVYATREAEMAEFQQRDPIDVMKQHIIDKDYKDIDKDFERIHAEVEKQVEEAVEYARQAPNPTPDELYTHVYA
jgi:pyruvate dehydrogenase E1 component alpha subunit